MSKFVGKFRKNKNYNDDYSYDTRKRHRDEHSEIKKLLTRNYEEQLEEDFDSEQVYQK